MKTRAQQIIDCGRDWIESQDRYKAGLRHIIESLDNPAGSLIKTIFARGSDASPIIDVRNGYFWLSSDIDITDLRTDSVWSYTVGEEPTLFINGEKFWRTVRENEGNDPVRNRISNGDDYRLGFLWVTASGSSVHHISQKGFELLGIRDNLLSLKKEDVQSHLKIHLEVYPD